MKGENGGNLSLYTSRPWLKFYDPGVPSDVEIPEEPLYWILENSTKDFPDRDALVFYGSKLTYSELLESAKRFARALTDKLGINKGDVISMILPNAPQFAIAYYGALMVGAVVSPMSPLYTAWEIERNLKINGARVVIALDILHERIEKARAETGLESVIYTGIDEYLPGLLAFLYKLKERKNKPPKTVYSSKDVYRFAELLRSSSPLREPESVDPKEDIAALMFTGGTTGLPKAAKLSHYNLLSNVIQVDAWYKRGVKGVDTYIGALPWFHIYGQTVALNAALYKAATIIVLPRPDVDEIIKAIQKYKANIFHGVPTLYAMVTSHQKVSSFDLSSVEVCISGAGPLPRAVHEKFEKLTGGKLREGYGLTETSPVTNVNPINGKYKIGSIGPPVSNTYAAVADVGEARILKPGETGELVISGPQVMLGYTLEEENEQAFFEHGGYRWLRTGDIGYMDDEGYFYVVDRKQGYDKVQGIFCVST